MVEDGEDGVGHCGPFPYAWFIIFEVFADGGGAGDFLQGVGEEVDVGLFDRFAIICGVFAYDSIGEVQDGDIVFYVDPVGVGYQSENAGGVCGVLEVGTGGGIGIGVVVNVFCPFVSGDNVVDIIVTGAISLYAAGPEVGCDL